jgi:hypothetical protein
MSETIPPPGGNPPETKNSALAIWSLVLGILSLVCCTIFAAIPGVICGHLALSRIKQSAGNLNGKSLATAGLITGYVGIALAIFWIPLMFAIAVPNFIRARETAQKNVCVENLKAIGAAKQNWALVKHKGLNDVPTFVDLAPYLTNGQLPSCPAGGVYHIGAVGEEPTCSIPAHQHE